MNRLLIVNADDFGQTEGITRGTIEAHEQGVVTSASLMVRWAAARGAAAYARRAPALGVGLHVDLGEWTCREGVWEPIYQRVDVGDRAAVEREVREQIERCRDLLGRNPTHLDSHQHVHRKEPVRSILEQFAATLSIPLRHFSPRIAYRGDFYGQTSDGEARPDWITPEAFGRLVRELNPGVTELACHPGYAHDLDSMYAIERTIELATLCDRDVRSLLARERVRLVSFAEVVAA